jgi:hypothetical protein
MISPKITNRNNNNELACVELQHGPFYSPFSILLCCFIERERETETE